MKNKRSTYLWVIIISLFVFGVIGAFLTIFLSLTNIQVLLNSNLFLNPSSNIFILAIYLIEAVISSVSIYKLYYFKKDVIKWTNIIFGFFVFRIFLDIFMGKGAFLPRLMIEWIIIDIIIVIIWISFVKHLKKIELNNKNIYENK
jgi:hypothetical protein